MKRHNFRLICLVLALLSVVVLSACSGKSGAMVNGYYTAEMAEFDAYGWKEFITIYVKDDKIVSVDYEAKNPSGFIKSWDMNYMRVMDDVCDMYPNKYVRIYSDALLSQQEPSKVQAVTGATHSFYTFQALASAALEQALSGDTEIVYVEAGEQ